MSMGSIHVHEFISLDGVIDAPAQLALLPGTTHEGLLDRVEWLSSMITRFLLPTPEAYDVNAPALS